MRLHTLLSSLTAAALVALTANPAPARAQAENIATARRLAYEGIDAIEKGDCPKGLDLLQRAEALYHAAIHLQYLARCYERAGNLVQATEAWRHLLREPLDENTHPVVHAAVDEAQFKLKTTLPLLGTSTLSLEHHYKDLKLVLDGRALDPALIGVSQVLDPGNHELSAEAPQFLPKVIRWSVEPGETRDIHIELAPMEENEARSDASGTEQAPGTSGAAWMQPTGYVALAAGGLSAVGGVWTLLQRNTQRNEIERECGTLSGSCAASAFGGDRERAEHAQNRVTSLTTWSNVLFVGAGALASGGAVLLLFQPDLASAPPAGAAGHPVRFEALVTPSEARVRLGTHF